jgi:hypothetical protein
MTAGIDPNPAVAGGSGLNPTTVTPVPAAGAGKGNATATTTMATTTAGAGAGAGTKATAGQSNLEKLLNQLGGAGAAAQAPVVPGAGTPGTIPEDPQWVTAMEDSVLAVAAKAQAQGGGGARRFMNYVAIAGCTPEDGKDLARMVESKWPTVWWCVWGPTVLLAFSCGRGWVCWMGLELASLILTN